MFVMMLGNVLVGDNVSDDEEVKLDTCCVYLWCILGKYTILQRILHLGFLAILTVTLPGITW